MFKAKNCIICGAEYIPNSGAAKTCHDPKCRKEYQKRHAHEMHIKRYKQKGSYKWEQPKGENSPFYKNGIGSFVRVAFENYPPICNRCGSTENLCVHHKDRNRRHNEVSNLEIICKSCHQKEHEAAKHLAESREKSREAVRAYHAAHPREHDEKGRFTTVKE